MLLNKIAAAQFNLFVKIITILQALPKSFYLCKILTD